MVDSKENKRETWIDLARGLAIILVVLGHVISSYHEAGLYKDSTLYNFTTQFIYSFHMPLFMMVSGCLYSKSRHKNKNYEIKKRLLSYGVPYIVFTVLWILMKLVLSSVTNSSVSLVDILKAIFYPVSFMWFIYALLIMQIIQILIGDVKEKGRIIHLLVSWGGYCIQPVLAKKLELIQFSDCIINDVLKNYIYFLIGVYLLPELLGLIKQKRMLWLRVSVVVLVIGNVIMYNQVFANVIVVKFVFAIAGCSFMVSLSQGLPTYKYLLYLGKQTLPIYVLQGFAIAATRLVLTKLGFNDSLGLVPLVVCTCSGVILPLVGYLLSKHIWKLEVVFYPTKYINIGAKCNESKI